MTSGLLTEVQGCIITEDEVILGHSKRGNMGDGESGHDVDDQRTDGIPSWVSTRGSAHGNRGEGYTLGLIYRRSAVFVSKKKDAGMQGRKSGF